MLAQRPNLALVKLIEVGSRVTMHFLESSNYVNTNYANNNRMTHEKWGAVHVTVADRRPTYRVCACSV